MKKTLLFILSITLLACNSHISIPTVNAANLSVSLYPPIVKVTIKPGKSISQVFKIENLSDNDKYFIARLIPFDKGDILGNPNVSPDNTADWLSYFSLANSKIKLNEPFLIKSGESDQILLNLSIPNTAPLKDRYVTLLVSSYDPNIDTTSQGSIISGSIGANLLITVSTTAYPPTVLNITSIIPSGTFIKIGNYYLTDNLTPLSITATVKNDGDYLTETKGFVRLMRGKNPVSLQSILPQNVISKSSRQLQNANGENFTLNPTLTDIGLHRFEIEIHSDNSNTVNNIEILFLPLKASLGFSLGLAILFTIVKFNSKPN